jgi:adenosylhomocysteine nucleosidase
MFRSVLLVLAFALYPRRKGRHPNSQLMRILVTFAVEAEFAPWRALRAFKKVRVSPGHWSGGVEVYEAQIGGCTVWVLLTGIGIKFFDFAMANCLKAAEVKLVLSSGLAGSLKPEFGVGEIVVPKKVGSFRDANGVSTRPALFEFAARRGATLVETLLTVDHIIETGEEKSRLAIFGDVVDMESVHVMGVFRMESLPVMTIRAISDASDEDLPIDFMETISPDGRVKIVSMLRRLVGHPTKIPNLVRFGWQSKGAARKLALFLDGFVESLTPEVLCHETATAGSHE